MKNLLLAVCVLVVSGCSEPNAIVPDVVVKPVVLAFSAAYCPFCWAAAPGISRLDDIAIVDHVDALVEDDLVQKYKITKVPTLVVLFDGIEEFRAVGADSPKRVREFLTTPQYFQDTKTLQPCEHRSRGHGRDDRHQGHCDPYRSPYQYHSYPYRSPYQYRSPYTYPRYSYPEYEFYRYPYSPQPRWYYDYYNGRLGYQYGPYRGW